MLRMDRQTDPVPLRNGLRQGRGMKGVVEKTYTNTLYYNGNEVGIEGFVF